MTWLVAGLGNPGPRYEATRHNAGFMVIDHLAEELGGAYWKDLGGAKIVETRLGGDTVVLALPQTFMNVSGASVARLAAHYDVPVERIIAVHDDIDLPPATVRAKRGGGHGGHNGLRSLHAKLGSGDYLRVRVGVGRPPGRQDPADYVLEPLGRQAAEDLGAAVLRGQAMVVHIIEHGVDSAMNEFNVREMGAE
ncbi:MAG: aminoacyl-tRNA hydrolase [Clostridiales bacterium]|nr:aminoacyl-tRNA hydrolase [Clostridiales bacterium]